MAVEMFEVGGCVRDELLGLPTKDIDYTVVASGGWNEMYSYLTLAGFDIFVESPQYLTIRARFPRDVTVSNGREVKGLTADFVLARREGQYTDGRRPDEVEPGTLADDLARRDFTVNAMAKDHNGEIIDLFGGYLDLEARLLRCVGTPEERFTEDALRALRALRFAITKGMSLDESVADALRSEWLPPLLVNVSTERKREELLRAFKHDTLATLDLLMLQTPEFREAVFADGLWLMPTLRA